MTLAASYSRVRTRRSPHFRDSRRHSRRPQTGSRERVASDGESPKIWAAFDAAGLVKSSALKMILLTGQRPGEVAHMRSEHIVDGWWELPGAPIPQLGWPGTKNGASHRVWLPAPALALLPSWTPRAPGLCGCERLAASTRAMRKVCRPSGSSGRPRINGEPMAAPHHPLGYGRDAMNRIQNHREGGIASVYDRHGYAEENKRIMEAVGAHIIRLAGASCRGQRGAVSVVSATSFAIRRGPHPLLRFRD